MNNTLNEIELLKVLQNEENIKYNILSDKEKLIYNENIKEDEKELFNEEYHILLKKFDTISHDTLKKITTIKIKTKRLENILNDEEYATHVKNNVYDVRTVKTDTLKNIIKSWIKDVKKVTNNNTLHLCFDTESCETLESFKKMEGFRDKYFPGFNFMEPEWSKLREFKEKLKKEGLVREVRVYSWSLGSVGSDKQIHGETLEEFQDLLDLIFTCIKSNDEKNDDKEVIGKNKSLTIDIHNLKWDIEFLKYYWVYDGVKHWHCKTQIDKERTFTTLEKIDNTIKGKEHLVYKEKLSKQPPNTFSVVVGKNQMYQCKWQLKEIKEFFKSKEGLKLLPIRRKVTFFDMYKKITKSLKEVSELLIMDSHFKKADGYDYKKIRLPGEFLNESEVQYQYNDVYVMTKFLEQIYYNRDMKGTTASSIAFNQMLDLKYKDIKGDKYKNGFLKHYPTMFFNPINNVIREIYRKSYDGGFTAGVKQQEGKVFEGIILALDINSAYPYQMRSGRLPYGSPIHGYGKYIPGDPLHPKHDICLQRVQFDGFSRKGPGVNDKGEGYGFIQLNKTLSGKRSGDNKFKIDNFTYTGRERPHTNLDQEGEPIVSNFECYWSQETLEFMLKTYDFYTYERHQVKDRAGNIFSPKGEVFNFRGVKKLKGLTYVDYVCFKSEVGYFAEFIDHNIFLKQIGKLLDNDSLTHMAKNGLNSSSGKMGSTYTRENYELMEHRSGILGYARPLDTSRSYVVSKEYYVPYISFITDYTRLKLMDIIYKLECKFGFDSHVFQGCDTDSLYLKIPYSKDLNTISKMIEYLKSLGITIDPIILGAWDIEKVIFKYKNLGSKKMMMDYVKFKDIDINMDCLELMDMFNKGDIKTKRKLTCAGLPEETREVITTKGYDYFSKNRDYVKLVKESCLGGYMLEYDVHRLTDSLFN